MVGGCAREKNAGCLHLLSILVSALISALGPAPAFAQRGVEFGYKDRIFEQNYLLPDPLDEQQAMVAAMLAMARPGAKHDGQPGLPGRRVIEAMGGACVDALYPDPYVFEKSPTQLELERLGNVKVPGDPGMGGGKSRTDRQLCLWQMSLFDAAFADPLSTDSQLDDLARYMRKRYEAAWVSAADIADPKIMEGARRATIIAIRMSRLKHFGIEIAAEAEISAKSRQVGMLDAFRWLAQEEPYATFERQLTALEENQLRAARGGARAERVTSRTEDDQPRTSAPQAPAEAPKPYPSEVAGTCASGRICRVLELTLFCRTPQQMAAILSQPPGPARKQLLGVMSSSGDCRQVAQGEAFTWTSAITSVQPKGEPAAELVPGTLADGTAGFLLKDGVIARTASANR